MSSGGAAGEGRHGAGSRQLYIFDRQLRQLLPVNRQNILCSPASPEPDIKYKNIPVWDILNGGTNGLLTPAAIGAILFSDSPATAEKNSEPDKL